MLDGNNVGAILCSQGALLGGTRCRSVTLLVTLVPWFGWCLTGDYFPLVIIEYLAGRKVNREYLRKRRQCSNLLNKTAPEIGKIRARSVAGTKGRGRATQ